VTIIRKVKESEKENYKRETGQKRNTYRRKKDKVRRRGRNYDRRNMRGR
jgi:hypothetical protein